MSRVARVPDDVVHVDLEYDVNGRPASIGFWLWNPGFPPPSYGHLVDLAADVILNENSHLVQKMHAGATFSTCRCAAGSSIAAVAFSFSAGVWTGGQAEGITLCLHWITAQPAKTVGAVTHLPAVPDAFIVDNYRVSQTGWGNLDDLGSDLLSDLSNHNTEDGGKYVPVCLKRRTRSGPLAAAIPVPIVGVRPSPTVSTMRRRMPRRGVISPL